MPPSLLMRDLAESRKLLGWLLDVIDGLGDATARLDAIRAVLAAFDWEHDDRQLALEEIERIATGGES